MDLKPLSSVHLRKAALVCLFYVSLVLAVPLLYACGGGPANGNATATLPPAGEDRGQAIFARYCNSCHPGGGRGAGPSLHTLAGTWSDMEIRTVVRQGKTRMPGYTDKVINDEELTDLVAYIRTMQEP
jgi:mono/diheme cytochrome c family protein